MAESVTDDSFYARRDRLVALLGQAAELEHAACCQYLFAAFSMRRAPEPGRCTWAQVEQIRGWKTTMLTIARMEMEHLAIVSNILTALGETAWFHRPPFPVAAGESEIGVELSLTTFGLDALGRFVELEVPDHPTDTQRSLVDYLKTSTLPADKRLSAALGAPVTAGHSIAALYDEIEQLVVQLTDVSQPPLFVGPPSAQVDNIAVFPSFPPVSNNARVYDMQITAVTDGPSVAAAIKQIRDEGEGGGAGNAAVDGNHFHEFATMYIALSQATRQDPSFTPGLPVVPNPIVASPWPADVAPVGTTTVTRPDTASALELYDLAYDVGLRMLARMFGTTPETDRGYEALVDTVFFPMMTLVFRPLGDVLVDMPAFTDPADSRRAGPTFRVPRDVGVIPHSSTAWTVLARQLEELRDRADALARTATFEPLVMERLQFLAQNLWRMHANFASKSGLGVEP